MAQLAVMASWHQSIGGKPAANAEGYNGDQGKTNANPEEIIGCRRAPAPCSPRNRISGTINLDEDPAVLADRLARRARRQALFVRLRSIAPAMFAVVPPQLPAPMAIGIYDAIVQQLGLDRIGQADLTSCWVFMPGATGQPAGEVTREQRTLAVTKLARLRVKSDMPGRALIFAVL